MTHHLVLYSKSGCHLCEGLEEKLVAIQHFPDTPLAFDIETRDITTRPDWFNAYQYEIPVLFWRVPSETTSGAISEAISEATQKTADEALVPIPRPSPRASAERVLKGLMQTVPQAPSL